MSPRAPFQSTHADVSCPARAKTGADGNRTNAQDAENSTSSAQGGAESGADFPESGDSDPDLLRLTDAWPDLPFATRRRILALADAALPPPDAAAGDDLAGDATEKTFRFAVGDFPAVAAIVFPWRRPKMSEAKKQEAAARLAAGMLKFHSASGVPESPTHPEAESDRNIVPAIRTRP